MYSIHLQVRPYLAEYCSRKYSWPVSSACKVPPSSELYYLFLDLLSVRPAKAPLDKGNLEFILPNRSTGKRPERFNYLSGRSQEKLEQYLYVMFWADFHRYAEYQLHVKGESLLMSVLLFKSKYCIESLSQEAFIKNYQRWRDRQSFLLRTYKEALQILFFYSDLTDLSVPQFNDKPEAAGLTSSRFLVNGSHTNFMISRNSAGVTTIGSFGKCLVFPVSILSEIQDCAWTLPIR